MSSELLAPSPPQQAPPGLLDQLRGKDNPFDVFVAPRRPGAEFTRFHVPTVYPELYDRLNAILDRYRLSHADRVSDLPGSGVVVIQGARGNGKTHAVHALETGFADALVIAPALYEPHRPFTEYLLHQLNSSSTGSERVMPLSRNGPVLGCRSWVVR